MSRFVDVNSTMKIALTIQHPMSATRRRCTSSSSAIVKCSTAAGIAATPMYANREKRSAPRASTDISVSETPISHVETETVSAKNERLTADGRSRAMTMRPRMKDAAATVSIGRADRAGASATGCGIGVVHGNFHTVVAARRDVRHEIGPTISRCRETLASRCSESKSGATISNYVELGVLLERLLKTGEERFLSPAATKGAASCATACGHRRRS